MSEVGQKIIASVRKHAAENPTFVYTPIVPPGYDPTDEGTCYYVVDGCASCLIGKGLWDADLIGAAFEKHSANSSPFIQFNGEHFPFMDQLDDNEVAWLGIVQGNQDIQKPWGQAVANADRQVKL